MEQATVEQAEPQGSAAPVTDTSAPANGDNGAASPASFGSLYKQRVIERAERAAVRAGVSSAGRETSAADEQPAPSTTGASRPGSPGEGADARAAAAQPGLSRSQRKALKTGQPSDEQSPAPEGSGDTSASGDDPVITRVERVERTVTEGLSRLEGLLKAPSPAEADPALDGDSQAYQKLFGDDAEFDRRAQIALHGSTTGQYLDGAESDELAVWAARREARDFSARQVNRQYQSNFSAMVTAAAAEFGIDPAVLSKPGTTFRDIFGAFVAHGDPKTRTELVAATEKLTKLEAANRLLADENEALQARLPASARSILTGGGGASSRSAAIADRERMNGRQLMRAGLAKPTQGRSGRPAGR